VQDADMAAHDLSRRTRLPALIRGAATAQVAGHLEA
jgi:hypothetical protein